MDVIYQVDNRMGHLIMDRVSKANALSEEMTTSLISKFKELESMNEIQTIVIKSNANHFCSGLDLEEMNSSDPNIGANLVSKLKKLLMTISHSPKIVIAQVKGGSIGGGVAIMAACDFVISEFSSWYHLPEIHLAYIAGLASPFIMRRTGYQNLKQLVLSGEKITSETAYSYGLVDRLVHTKKIDQAVKDLSSKYSKRINPEVVGHTKEFLNKIYDLTFSECVDMGEDYNNRLRIGESFSHKASEFLKS